MIRIRSTPSRHVRMRSTNDPAAPASRPRPSNPRPSTTHYIPPSNPSPVFAQPQYQTPTVAPSPTPVPQASPSSAPPTYPTYTTQGTPYSPPNILQHPATSSGIPQHPTTSPQIPQNPPAFSNILQHPPTSYNILQEPNVSLFAPPPAIPPLPTLKQSIAKRNVVHLTGTAGSVLNLSEKFTPHRPYLALWLSIQRASPADAPMGIYVYLIDGLAQQVLTYVTDGMELAITGSLRLFGNELVVDGSAVYAIEPDKRSRAAPRRASPQASYSHKPTQELFQQGLSVAEIAEQSKLGPRAVMDQLFGALKGGLELDLGRMCMECKIGPGPDQLALDDLTGVVTAALQNPEAPRNKDGSLRLKWLRDTLLQNPALVGKINAQEATAEGHDAGVTFSQLKLVTWAVTNGRDLYDVQGEVGDLTVAADFDEAEF